MNRNYLLLLLCWLPMLGFSQSSTIDSLSKALSSTHSDTGKAILLRKLSAEFSPFNPNTALELAMRSHLLATRSHFLEGQSDALNAMASSYRSLGNYPLALDYYIKQLKIVEGTNDFPQLARINMNISNVYQEEGDQVKALTYALVSNKLIEENKISALRFYSYANLADIYEKLRKAESALVYGQKAFAIADQQKDGDFIGVSLTNLGNVYVLKGEPEIALAHYRNAIPYLEATKREDFLCESLVGISKILFENGATDSAIYYATRSLEIAQKDRFAKHVLSASTALNKYYSQSGNIALAYQYQANVMAMKDSIYGQEKIKQLQNLTIVENLRQKEMAEMKRLEKEERDKRLQLLLVGLLVPLSFLISILLSKKKVKPRLVEFSGIVSLLLFFEYITMLIHPWVMEVTHHTPAYEIIIFVIIAAIITPSHHRIEHWMISRLTRHRGKKYETAPKNTDAH